MRVLYVTNRVDAPYRYRCLHPALLLRAAGVTADLAHMCDERLFDRLPHYSVIVLFRLPWSQRVSEVVDAARRQKAGLFFDIDDLVFDESFLPRLGFLQNAPPALWRHFSSMAGRMRRTFDACDAFLGATPALVRAAEQLGKPAYLHPNLLHPGVLRDAGRLWRMRERMQRYPLIGYMSGSATHNDDFAMIAPALRRVLNDRHDARLLIAGFLDLPADMAALANRVIRVPYLDWRIAQWTLALARVNLAPLAKINDFTNSKSDLKYFEAGAVGVPTVATPADAFRASIRHGENGLLAESPEAWHACISECLDIDASRRIGRAAREAVKEFHSRAAHGSNLVDVIARHDGHAARSGRPAAGGAWDIADPQSPWRRARDVIRRVRARIGVVRRAEHPEHLHQPVHPIASHLHYETVRIDPADLPHRHANVRTLPSGWIYRDGIAIGLRILGPSPAAAQWTRDDHITLEPTTAHAAWMTCGHTDPCLLSSPLDAEARRFAALYVRMSAEGDDTETRAQFFWNEVHDTPFNEDGSVRFAALTDGQPHDYIVDLRATNWVQAEGYLRQFRFDPLDHAGSFRIEEVVLLTTEAAESLDVSKSPAAPPDAAAAAAPRGIDIVIPIYNARVDVERCVESVLRHARGDWRMILVDDASTDEDLVQFLQQTAAREPRVDLRRNARNCGFVLTANAGIRASKGRDVLLLNSDTIVTADFLERLRAVAAEDPACGIVCPLTNNGTICSIPEFCRDNPLPDSLDLDQYADLVRRTSLRMRPDLVTAVGFCMFIRRDVIDKIGEFDEQNFGRGYGEENDYCERAKLVGFRIRLADDLFVAHMGRASFQGETSDLQRENSRVLAKMHPGYFPQVSDFCRRNPLAPIQNNVRYQLARRKARAHRALLYVLHADPFSPGAGGTEHHVRDLIAHLKPPRAVVAWPDEDALSIAEVHEGRVDKPVLHRFRHHCKIGRYELRHPIVEWFFGQILDVFDVAAARIDHLLGWPVGIWREMASRSIPFFYTIHDYYCVCPSVNLMNHATSQRCECPALSAADSAPVDRTACISAQYHALQLAPPADCNAALRDHREEFGRLLAAAERVIAPSQATLDIVLQRYSESSIRSEVIEHGYDAPPAAAPAPAARPDGPLRIALIGQIAYPIKGADVYIDLMSQLAHEPFDWHVFGDVETFDYNRRLLKIGLNDRLHLHGRYKRNEIIDLLRRHAIDLVVLMPICHETFCFTLSEAWLAGVPVIVSDLGALPGRVRDTGAGLIARDAADAAALLKNLRADPAALADLKTRATAFRHRSLAENAELHRRAFGQLWKLVTTPAPQQPYNEVDAELFRAWCPPVETAQPVAPASSLLTYQQSWWYPWYRRMRLLVPPSARAIARRIAVARRTNIVRKFAFNGHTGNWRWSDMQPLGHSRESTRFRCTGRDPFVIFDPNPLPARLVRAVRLTMRCNLDQPAHAQLFWRHRDDEPFTETKSLSIPLDRTPEWREYVVDLAASGSRGQWESDDTVFQVRLDPVNTPAEIELKELALVSYRD